MKTDGEIDEKGEESADPYGNIVRVDAKIAPAITNPTPEL